jgi:hypothetical protein
MEEAWLDRHPDAVSVHLEQFPDHSGGMEGRRAGGEVASRSARSAASSPARWRSSVATRASAPRWRPRPSSSVSDPELAGRDRRMSTWPRSASPAGSRSWSGCTRRGFHARRGEGRRRSCRHWQAAAKCARSWRYTTDVGSDPEFPDVSRVTRRHCRNSALGTTLARRPTAFRNGSAMTAQGWSVIAPDDDCGTRPPSRRHVVAGISGGVWRRSGVFRPM